MKLTIGKGMDENLTQLGNLEMKSPEAMGKAIYKASGTMYDAIKANIEKMPVDDRPFSERITGIRSIQKKGLIESLGIAHARTDYGYRNTKIGFDGYNRLITNEYPYGQPNAMIARTFESGNSFTKKIPFVGPAVRANREKCEAQMKAIIDEEIIKIFSI